MIDLIIEFVKLWRSVAVDGVDDKTIEDYLQKQGIASMANVGLRRIVSINVSTLYMVNSEISITSTPNLEYYLIDTACYSRL